MTDTIPEAEQAISPDTADELADTPYRVTLVLTVAGDNPAEAVEKALEAILEQGLRTWSYWVTHRPTGQEAVVHRGETYSRDDYLALVLAEQEARAGRD